MTKEYKKAELENPYVNRIRKLERAIDKLLDRTGPARLGKAWEDLYEARHGRKA